jgi:DNA-binding MarR family transcriptional regulator
LKLEEFLPYRLAILSSVVSNALANLCQRHDLTVGEWLALMSLGELGMMTAKGLGIKNQMHKTKVSRIVAGLLERQLISRRSNQIDLRESFLQLTPLGKSLYDECAPRAVEFLKRLEDSVSAEDRAVLDRCLRNIGERSRRLITDSSGTRFVLDNR